MPENDLIVSAQLEIADIDRKLAGIEPLQKRRSELAEFLRVAETMKPVAAHTDALMDSLQPKGTLKEQIQTGAKRLIATATDGWMLTRAIVSGLEREGVVVPGADDKAKVLRVSQILGRSDDFVTERGRGWSLRQRQLRGSATLGASASH